MEAVIIEILRGANNRDEVAVKSAVDQFIKNHSNNLNDLVNRILTDEFSSQVN